MAATAMDPVDIANILAQELLYQQVIVDTIISRGAIIDPNGFADCNIVLFRL